jgi:tetratricopeptide (TPR) repeat protein
MRTILIISLILYFAAPAFAGHGDAEMADGIALFYQEKWNDAIPHFEQALREDPQNSLALAYILHTYYKKKDINSIIKEIEQKAHGEDPIATAHLGMAYFLRGMIQPNLQDQAQTQFNLAIERDPELAIGYTGLGMVYFQKRMIPRSKGYFEKALRINPNDVMALELLGNILLVDEKEPEEALVLFQRTVALVPTYPDGYYYTGSVLVDLGRYEEAIEPLELAMELDPKRITKGFDAAALLGEVYLKLGHPEKARPLLERHLPRQERWDWVDPPEDESSPWL